MDTEAIYRAVCAYGASKAAREPFESDENMAEIKRLLKEAEDERAELVKAHDELLDKLAKKAELLRGCYARINGLEKHHRTVTYVCPVCAASLERQE